MADEETEQICKRPESPEINNAQDVVRGRELKVKKCPNHLSQDISIFCRPCNQLICPVCLTNQHQQHTMCDLKTIHHEKLDILSQQGHVITNDFIPFFTMENENLYKILTSHREHFEKTKHKIKDQEEKLIKEIKKQTKDLVGTLAEQLRTTEDEIQNRNTKLDDTIKVLNTRKKNIEATIISDNIIIICETADDMLSYVTSMDISAIPLPRNNKEFREGDIQVEAVTSLVGTLEELVIPDTAEVQIQHLKTYLTDLNGIEKIVSGENIWIKNSSQSLIRSVQLKENLSIIDEMKQIKVKDMALTNEGDLLLAIEDKPKIKIVKKGEKEMECFHKFTDPWIGKPQVPVSLHVNKDNVVIVGSVERGAKWSLMTEYNTRQITLLSEDTKEILEFDEDQQHLFSFPHRITTNSIGEILILDKLSSSRGRITLITIEKTRKWTYSGHNTVNSKQPFDPWDFGITCHDNIIICDMRNDTFHILNSDGNIIALVSTETLGIKFPVCVKLVSSEELIIGCGTEFQQEAKIHSLKFKDF